MANLAIINKLIEERNLSVTEFCLRANISAQSLREIVKRNSTKTDILERFAAVLHVPVGVFFNEQSNVTITGRQIHTGVGNQIMQTPEEQEIEHLKSLLEAQAKLIDEKEQRIQDKDSLISMLHDQIEHLKAKIES